MRCLLFACLLLGSFPSFALDRLQVEGYLLPNGLQVLLKPGYEKGHVAIRLVVGIGFDDFPCQDKELPHLLEHLLFSGVDDSGEGGLEEHMQALGGEWNAFTSNADTTFVIEAPARNQRKVLDLLLEIMTRTELSQAHLDGVKRVVEREDGGHSSHLQRLLDRRDSGRSASSQLAVELGLKCAERPEVGGIKLEHIEEVFANWYAPNNMTLIVVGDLDKLLPAYLERTYGKLAPTDPIDHPPLAQSNGSAEPRRELQRGGLGDSAKLHLIYPEPQLDEQHDETWDLVKGYLDWALYTELRLKRNLSYGPSAEREVFGDSGFLSLNADVERDDVTEAEQDIRALVETLQKDGMQPAMFARLQQLAIDRQSWATQGNSALADYYWSALNDYEKGRFEDPAKRIKAVSLETANLAMRQLLAQPGYMRIEKPLLSYESLYGLIAGVLSLIVALGIWRWRTRHK
ncbi:MULTISPECIES: M16 family metallopeptidase [Pseudomonas syringae group]|uniref:M16 family metallopeptidase n=1 Tax=Pseudomonas syringae group TaxID=136849 RepID=UPI0006ABDA6D|nr:pitrilysin family protein [Pseudomonas coronafaciens]KOP57234.1 peptidase M16 [Pseudomonas coronafaciens pv. porri]KPY20681.1 Peptidase, M16 family protein [Pseudomonas coronafaciens pv. porri]RMW04267.1 Peptidase, M16 protein [Pseudomonas coronafaciens pv. porri]RMW05049.1 Peptidase, M16 protein [Pseudomonas coronafaciens pv. porri]